MSKNSVCFSLNIIQQFYAGMDQVSAGVAGMDQVSAGKDVNYV